MYTEDFLERLSRGEKAAIAQLMAKYIAVAEENQRLTQIIDMLVAKLEAKNAAKRND